jgi:hypothetical protein
MIKREEVEKLERLIGQLEGAYNEIAALAKRSPNDGVNAFKINLVNKIVEQCNSFLHQDYRPVPDFDNFDVDSVPSNGDVTFVLSQYLRAAERFRSDNLKMDFGKWYYNVPAGGPSIRAAAPAKLRK